MSAALILIPLFFYCYVVLLYFTLSKRHFHKPLSLSLIISGLFWIYESVFEQTGVMSFAGFTIWLAGFLILHSLLYKIIPEEDETFDGFIFEKPAFDMKELAFRLLGIFLMMFSSHFFIRFIIFPDFFSKALCVISFLALLASFLLISGNYGYLLFLIPVSITLLMAFIISFIVLRLLGAV
ncbi:MAG: hypothetical protein QW540_09725 [Archaeoglobaceae archaeon]